MKKYILFILFTTLFSCSWVADVWVYQGNSALKSGNVLEANEYFQKALDMDKNNPEAHYYLALMAEGENKMAQALDFLSIAISQREVSRYYYQRARIYNKQGNAEEALADLDKAIGLNPKEAAYYLMRAKLYEQFLSFEMALKDLNQTLKLNPNISQAYEHRARLFRAQKKYNQALKDYVKVIKLQPNNPSAYYGLGVVLLKKKDCHRAEQSFRKSCALGYLPACSYRCQ